MKINQFIWENYKNSEDGKNAIEFYKLDTEEKVYQIIELNEYSKSEALIRDKFDLVLVLYDYYKAPESIDLKNVSSKQLIETILSYGIKIKDNEGNIEVIFDNYNENNFLYFLEEISLWLSLRFSEWFFPYFFSRNFRFLKRICDAFEITLPEEPKKRDKYGRAFYYHKLCEVFQEFKAVNHFTFEELNAFLYHFAPNYLGEEPLTALPPATQVWMVGGNIDGTDNIFFENINDETKSFWQGNLNTKKGDIIVMYCLSPISAIHSIWRATEDGVIDPFFHYYSSIQIGFPIKIPHIKLSTLKTHPYFKNNPKVRANMQGVNGYNLSNEDYRELLKILSNDKNFDVDVLPQLYQPDFNLNIKLKNEREVELKLVEPFIEKIGYKRADWERQVSVRMGRGERNYPDYVIFPTLEKGFESGKMLIEVKYDMSKNKDLEDSFIQAHSYALRLQSSFIILCDKNAIWIYPKTKNGFDRTNYIKKYWKELENVDEFNIVKNIIGKEVLMNR